MPASVPETVAERLLDPHVQERLYRYAAEAQALLGDAARAIKAIKRGDADTFWTATWELTCVVAVARAVAAGPARTRCAEGEPPPCWKD
jgi:hypothetical protein